MLLDVANTGFVGDMEEGVCIAGFDHFELSKGAKVFMASDRVFIAVRNNQPPYPRSTFSNNCPVELLSRHLNGYKVTDVHCNSLSILSRIGVQVRSTFVALRAWQPSFCLRHRIEMKPSRLIFATTALHLHNASRPFTGAGVADMHQRTTHAARRLWKDLALARDPHGNFTPMLSANGRN
jgi:hypothetical protein